MLFLRRIRVDEFEVSGSENLETIGVLLAGVEALGSKAGAWIIDFDQADRLGRIIAHGGINIVRVAAEGG